MRFQQNLVLVILSFLSCSSNSVTKSTSHIPFDILEIREQFKLLKYSNGELFTKAVNVVEFESTGFIGLKPCIEDKKVKIRKLSIDDYGVANRITYYRYKSDKIRTIKKLEYTINKRAYEPVQIEKITDSETKEQYEIHIEYAIKAGASIEKIYDKEKELVAYVEVSKNNKYIERKGFIRKQYLEDKRKEMPEDFINVKTTQIYRSESGMVDSIRVSDPTPVNNRGVENRYYFSYDSTKKLILEQYNRLGWIQSNKEPWRRDTTEYVTYYSYDPVDGNLMERSISIKNEKYPSRCYFYEYE